MRVLICDDSDTDRAAARSALERIAAEADEPIVVEEVAHGGAALDALMRGPGQRPDLLICDVKMPVMVEGHRVPSGPEVMRFAEGLGVRVMAYTTPGFGWARPLSHAPLISKGCPVYPQIRSDLVPDLHLQPLAAAG